MRLFRELSKAKQIELLLRARDPVFFAENKWFLGNALPVGLWPKQREILRQFYTGGYNELYLMAGMRSGKTFLGSVMGCYDLMSLLTLGEEPWRHYNLSPVTLFIICVATAKEQAEDTIYAAMRDKIELSPYFLSFFEDPENPDIYSFEMRFFDGAIKVEAQSSNSASGAGRTSKAVIFDEMAKFDQSNTKRGGMEVYTTLRRSTRTLWPDSHVIAISSPMHVYDTMVTLCEQKQEDPKALVLKHPTWELNPNLRYEDFATEEARDPILFWRDYGAVPASDIEVYYREPDIITWYERGNYFEPKSGNDKFLAPGNYVLSGDPALRHDAFGLALGHTEQNNGKMMFVVDGITRFKPTSEKEVDPLYVEQVILNTVDNVPVSTFISDTWNFPGIQQRVENKGITVVNQIVRKPQHDRVKELFYEKQLVCPYHKVLDMELKQLLVKTGTKVDHPKGGSKDMADALANLVWQLDELATVSDAQPAVMVKLRA